MKSKLFSTSTFPYALHSTPTFNAKAIPVKFNGKSYSYPDYWRVWSPIHGTDHFVGRYTTEEAAQRRADKINETRSQWIYCGYFEPESIQKVYDWLNEEINHVEAAKRSTTKPEFQPNPESPLYRWCNQTQCYILGYGG